MAIALVQSKTGSATTASVSPAFDTASTTGNLVVLAYGSDDYNGTVDTGWTESAEMEQQTFLGAYIWWRISTGQTSFTYTIGSATVSAWILAEFSGIDPAPYDGSQGLFIQASLTTMTTDPVTPTAGDRLLVAAIGGSASVAQAGSIGTWTNSFTGIAGANTGATGATNDTVGMAYQLVTANGSTAYSTGATYPQIQQSRTALIIAFKAAAAPGQQFTPDADTVTTGWATAPLFSKINDASDATVITGALA